MNTRLNSVHDLTRGNKEYLKGFGITPQQFDKMDTISQQEWKEECNINAYNDSWSRKESVGAFTVAIKGFKEKENNNKRHFCNHIFPCLENGRAGEYCEKCGLHIYEINKLSIKRILKLYFFKIKKNIFKIKEMFYVINRFKQPTSS